MKLDYSVVNKPKERPARYKVITWGDKHNWPNPLKADFPSGWKQSEIEIYRKEYNARNA